MTWTLVQTAAYATPNTATNAPSATFTSTVGSGNLIVGHLTHFSPTVNSITDDKSNTYTQFQALNDTTDGVLCVGFYSLNLTNGPKTVTANLSTSDFCMLVISEWSNSGGAATATDGNAGQFQNNIAGGTNNATSGNLTTTADGNLCIGTCMDGSSATVPTLGTNVAWANVTSSTGSTAVFSVRMESFTQTTHGAIAATGTVVGGNDPCTSIIAFKAPSGAAAPTFGWSRDSDIDSRARPVLLFQRDEARQWFVRSPNPVPQQWQPTTGMEDRLPEPKKRPDDSSIEGPQFFRNIPKVPGIWLPTTGQEDRPPNPNRIPSPDQFFPWFRPSQIPVPQRWQPTTGQEDRPKPPLPADIATSWTPRPFAAAVGISGMAWWRPVEVLVGPKPPSADIGTSWSPQVFAATVGISGIAWFTPAREERLPPVKGDPYAVQVLPWFIEAPLQQVYAAANADDFNPLKPVLPADIATSWVPRVFAAPVGISGMAWFNPPETRLPPVKGDPYAIQVLPWFIAPPLAQFYAQTNADDFYPLKPVQPADITTSWAPRAFAAPVGISGMAWWRPIEVLVGPPPPSAEWGTQREIAVPPQPVGISGIAWFNPPETRPPPFRPDAYAGQQMPWFIEAPLQQVYAAANADDFNPLKLITQGDGLPSFVLRPVAPPVGISGIAWWRQTEVFVGPPPPQLDYVISWNPQFITPPAVGILLLRTLMGMGR